MRYLNKSLKEAEDMTLREYRLQMTAYQLRQIDKEYDIFKIAWYERIVKSKKRAGKGLAYRYTRLNQIFDYDKEIDKILNKDKEEQSDVLKKFIERKRNNG